MISDVCTLLCGASAENLDTFGKVIYEATNNFLELSEESFIDFAHEHWDNEDDYPTFQLYGEIKTNNDIIDDFS